MMAKRRPYDPACCPIPQLCIIYACTCKCHECHERKKG